ncbi:hypothetical protein QR680_007732 [Steinernema hermaphroditum]|uniref:Uncharacterized protein n=1 Tax=Steinernema hermaphroditum TaxID=289476 RepID=A0AA39M5T8_9BILA|nr:hypothetical protein QR680_007732 [Steinernema hermaphroditum]
MLSRLVLQSPGGVAADAQSTRPPEPWRSRRRCSVNSSSRALAESPPMLSFQRESHIQSTEHRRRLLQGSGGRVD